MTNVSEWISVEDELPEIDAYVLCSCIFDKDPNHNTPIVSWLLKWDNCDKIEFKIERDGYYKVTHWMPIPTPQGVFMWK